MSTAVADPLLGRLLDGRYEIRRRLAAGGMATVYAAIDTRLDRPVAVKVMHPALAADEEFVARFRREAKAAARLSAPTVVNVTDQGQDAGTVFLVMELIEGRTLRDVLRQDGALSPARAVAVISPVLEALSVAHAAGYVHRDVKPENVLIADDGRIKVGDFGLARAVDASPLTATTGLLLGTVAYLAPEQVRRGVADARTDVYACGVLLFEVLTGRPPFEGDTALSVAYQHLHDRVPAPSSLNPDVPDELDELVLQATEPDPDDRPVDAGALLEELRHVAEFLPTSDEPRSRRLLAPPDGDLRAEDDHQTTRFGDLSADDPAEDPVEGKVEPGEPDDALDDHDADDLDHRSRTRRRFGPIKALRRLRPSTMGWLALLLVTLLAVGSVWWLTVGRGVQIPSTAALDPGAAELRLRNAGFTVVRGADDYSETAPRGTVASTVPSSGARADKGSRVVLRVSLGPERYTLLPLRGRTFDVAVRTLATQKLKPGTVQHSFDDGVPVGQVISSDPPAGTVLRPGSEVALRVSDGPAPITVPNVVGQPVNDADRTLTRLSLKVTLHGVFSDTVPLNQVMELQPASDLHRGQTVTLVFSQGPELIEIPNVVGQSRANAIATLQARGFQVRVLNVPGFDSFVARAVPSAGSKARRGALITLVLA
ncbi:MAG TPA: Stk1 family PASTA domain-containing Ser/Thr kinase [Frankiaceae bacterium]|nr:Stk1 family PASTA domain-containing Ser/Thr kinase [Frankiaceae bacterium]